MAEEKFDEGVAKKLREERGITKAQLARKIWGINPQSAFSRISQIEGGLVEVIYPTKGFTEKYLLWLKEHGYNPYNL